MTPEDNLTHMLEAAREYQRFIDQGFAANKVLIEQRKAGATFSLPTLRFYNETAAKLYEMNFADKYALQALGNYIDNEVSKGMAVENVLAKLQLDKAAFITFDRDTMKLFSHSVAQSPVRSTMDDAQVASYAQAGWYVDKAVSEGRDIRDVLREMKMTAFNTDSFLKVFSNEFHKADMKGLV